MLFQNRPLAVRVMKTATSVIATNDVITLADGSREVMADCALEDGARQINDGDGLPFLIEHDWLRPCGWTQRAWTEPDGIKLRLITESMLPESDDEVEMMNRRFNAHMSSWKKERTAPFEEFAKTLAVRNLELTFDTDSVFLEAPNLVRQVCPTALSESDKDGLMRVRKDAIDANGRLRDGRFSLVPSMLLRPSFGLPNAPNRELMTALLRLAKDSPACEVRLAIDQNRLGLPDSQHSMLQRDYWWGPHYRGSPVNQPYGLTVHGPTKYDQLNGLIRTEFWWYGKAERTFEVEELIDLPRRCNGKEVNRASRFVHSIFDGDNVSRHIDGAIRLYPEHLWQQRTATKITEFGKRATRVKLWRVDGSVNIDRWYELIHMFFRGNYTIAEYFGLPSPDVYRSEFEQSLKDSERT